MWIQVQRMNEWYPAMLMDIYDDGVIVQSADFQLFFVPNGKWGLLW